MDKDGNMNVSSQEKCQNQDCSSGQENILETSQLDHLIPQMQTTQPEDIKNIKTLDKVYQMFIRLLLIQCSLVLFFGIIKAGLLSTIVIGLTLLWCIVTYSSFIKKRKDIITDKVVINAFK